MEITSLSAIEHVIKFRCERIKVLVFSEIPSRGRLKEVHDQARKHAVRIEFRSSQREPVTALLLPFEYADFKNWNTSLIEKKRSVVLLLDHLQDPQNLGTLCRLADAFSVDGIIIPKERSVGVSPGVYHASVGAVETVPVVLVPNLSEALRRLKDNGFWAVGATLADEATPPWSAPDFEKVVITLGSELESLSRNIENLCDHKIRIPLTGKVESLNVATAGAILLYEAFRKKQAASL